MGQFTHAYQVICNQYPMLNWTAQDDEIDRRGRHPDLHWCLGNPVTRLEQWPKELRDLAPKRFDPITGTTYCYPSSGGVWESQLHPLTLEKLDVDRFNPAVSDWHTGREDEWCDQLRIYGGNWYGCNLELPWEERRLGCPSLASLSVDLPIRRLVVTETDTTNVYILLPNQSTGEFPEGAAAAMKNTVTEKEQIEVMKAFGAVWCTNKDSCPPLEDIKWPPVKWAAKYWSFKIPDGWEPAPKETDNMHLLPLWKAIQDNDYGEE